MAETDTTSVASRPGGMLCPVCKVNLSLSERQGIEIDYCPTCRGVWLDRGELDKIIERNATFQESPQRANAGGRIADRDDDAPGPWARRDGHHRSDHHGEGRHGGHRRRGFLGGLFDH